MNKKNILAIEECSAVNYILNSVLKKDFAITSVNNCNSALQAIRTNCDQDVIILNIPDEESENYKFLNYIHSSALLKDTKTIVISNYDDDILRDKTRALGASLYLSKPFDPVFLSESIQSMLGDKKPLPQIKKRKFSFSLNIF